MEIYFYSRWLLVAEYDNYGWKYLWVEIILGIRFQILNIYSAKNLIFNPDYALGFIIKTIYLIKFGA